VLDANTLLAPRLADLLFDLYLVGLYYPRWTEQIEAEFLRNWAKVTQSVAKRPSQSTQRQTNSKTSSDRRAVERLATFRAAVGDECHVSGFDDPLRLEKVPPQVDLNDRHVACAAIVLQKICVETNKLDQVFLVTKNLVDLAPIEMSRLGVRVIAPGPFIDTLLERDPKRVETALSKTASDLRAPPHTKEQLISMLKLHGATRTARYVKKLN
jgi:hypothetical protein